MERVMFTVEEVAEMIKEGRNLLLAGDEKVLSRLPKGNWAGGTIPYFMGDTGGEFTQEKIYVTQLHEAVSNIKIKKYDADQLKNVYSDIGENDVACVIIPASSKTHLSFSIESPSYEGFGTKPLIGWIAGVNLEELGTNTPKVYDGSGPSVYEDRAVVMIATFPENIYVDINIINIFSQGKGDEIVFNENGFSVKSVMINGKEQNFAEYVSNNKLDVRLPLVADYYGVSVNTSFQKVDEEKGEVVFYAPVFKGMVYKQAEPVKDYIQEFTKRMGHLEADDVVFSCNCILNYLFSELEGKKTGDITGPMTFGEIAYQLLNQTMVYMTVHNR